MSAQMDLDEWRGWFDQEKISEAIALLIKLHSAGNSKDFKIFKDFLVIRKIRLGEGIRNYIENTSDFNLEREIPIILEEFKDSSYSSISFKRISQNLISLHRFALHKKVKHSLAVYEADIDDEITLPLSTFNELLANTNLEFYFETIKSYTRDGFKINMLSNALQGTPFVGYEIAQIRSIVFRLFECGVTISRKTNLTVDELNERNIDFVTSKNGAIFEIANTKTISEGDWFDPQLTPHWLSVNSLLLGMQKEESFDFENALRLIFKYRSAWRHCSNEALDFISNQNDKDIRLIEDLVDYLLENKEFDSDSIRLALIMQSDGYSGVFEKVVLKIRSRFEQEAQATVFREVHLQTKVIRSHNWKDLDQLLWYLTRVYQYEPQSFFAINNMFFQYVESTRTREFLARRDSIVAISEKDVFLVLKLVSVDENVYEWNRIVDFANSKGLDNYRFWMSGIHLALRIRDFELLEKCKNLLVSEHSQRIQNACLDYLIPAARAGDIDECIEILDLLNQSRLIHPRFITEIVKSTDFGHWRRVIRLIDFVIDKQLPCEYLAFASFLNRLIRADQCEFLLDNIDRFTAFLGENPEIFDVYKSVAMAKNGMNVEAIGVMKSIVARQVENKSIDVYRRIVSRANSSELTEIVDALAFEFNNEINNERIIAKKYVAKSEFNRNKALPREIKNLYDDSCQICGTTLETPFGRFSQAAHIQAVGSPHFGPDDLSNLLCLCPNHHTLFDNGGIYVNDRLEIVNVFDGSITGKLTVSDEHKISLGCIEYHRNYTIASTSKKVRRW